MKINFVFSIILKQIKAYIISNHNSKALKIKNVALKII